MKARTRNRLLVLALYVGVIAAGAWIGMQLQRIDFAALTGLDPATMWQLLVLGLIVFVVLSAIPFIPGAEIGLGLLLIFGRDVALLVYAAMVTALTLSYLVGFLVPPSWIARFFGFIGFQSARCLVEQLADMDRRERVDFLLKTAPSSWVPYILKNRYFALMMLFNIPGNSLAGGGGGIALAAGMSGFFRLPLFIATVLVGVAPVPLFFWLTM